MTACAVIVTLTCDPGDQEALLGLARGVLPAIARQPGFRSSAVHKGADGTRIVNYLRWYSEADHLACMQSEEVAAAGGDFMAFVEARGVTIEIGVYEVVDTVDAA